jgi:hypothetical protein
MQLLDSSLRKTAGAPVGPVTEGGPSRALEGLEGEGRGSARLIGLEGDDQVGGCGVYQPVGV